ncbi:8336_t:CDS:10 [Acaulospora morrowiae]|uniref:Corrinoid adenosyltransferase MMAB n=1 Tax=Acaulospora morrowiae TaxID=94023 RepID=A0A9N8V839_9GLOM|nr:8336_t:CDS:10 [Acaulospora morrowiae]
MDDIHIGKKDLSFGKYIDFVLLLVNEEWSVIKGKSNLYTRTGDKGTSSLYNGERRSKHDDIFHALGTVDELSSSIGIARHYCIRDDNGLSENLKEIQCKLIEVGSNIATPRNSSNENKLSYTSFDEENVTILESWIDHLDSKLPPLKNFILPSGGESAVFLHQCRSVCRRAERVTVPLVESGIAESTVGKYLNRNDVAIIVRLSDYFFVAARYAAMSGGFSESFYKHGRENRLGELVTRNLKSSD